MTRVLRIAVVVLAATPALTLAQELPSDRFDAAVVDRLGHPIVPEPGLPALDAAADQRAGAGLFSWSGVLHTLGGALVGGWVGYVGSQVALSDWEKETNSSFRDQRLSWVAGGMAVGVLGSWVIGGTGSPAGALAPAPGDPGSDRMWIGRSEIRGTDASDVYALIQSIRPEWLRDRGVQSWSESARGHGDEEGVSVTPGRDRILVYLDDLRLGGVDELRSIAPTDIDHLQFIGPREATYRYGTGHSHGVILLSTAPDA